jgi:threonine synthase
MMVVDGQEGSRSMGHVVGATLVRPDGSSSPLDSIHLIAESPEGLVELQYDYGPHLIPTPSPAFEGMWRWRDLLPIKAGPIRYPLSVGGTPLLAPPGLRAMLGMPNLWLKDETRSPTGSNKDRATALVLEDALRTGADTVTAASTGNVAVSVAVGAAAAGLRAVIFVPAGVNEAKLRVMLLAGATVFKVKEGYKAAFKLSRWAARELGWHDRNTGANPMTLEAKKTVALEVWEQLGREVPDVMVIPVGDGTTLSAIAKGFRELVACDVAGRVPRLIGVQAEACQPLRSAWCGERCTVGKTIADGIAVAAPANAPTALRDVRETGGCFLAVSDDSILTAIQTLAIRAGVIAEPAAAAGLAGLEKALAEGQVGRDERVVALITGSGLKTPHYLQPAGRAFLVHKDLEEVKRALRE